MKRSKKWLLILSLVLLLPTPVFILWGTSQTWQKYLHLELPDLGQFSQVATWYLIIVGIIVLVVLIISLIVILCWPIQKKFKLIHRKTGQVKVTNKAINGFIMASISDLPYLKQPKVNSRLTKHRLKIRISGNLGKGENVAALLDNYLKEVGQDLHQLLGIEQKPKIDIRFTNYNNSGSKDQKRVQ